MDTPLNLDRLTKQTQRREFLDGLRDLHIGIVILVLSLLNWFILSPFGATLLVKAVLHDKTLTLIGVVGLLALFLLLVFGTERLIERIRRASLWKDSGFVKPLRYGFNKWLVIASTFVVLALIVGTTWLMAVGVLPEAYALRSIPTAASLGTGILFLGIAHSLKLRRYYGVGGLGILLSIFLFLSPSSFALAWLFLGLGWAIILIASGLWALRLALQELRSGMAHE